MSSAAMAIRPVRGILPSETAKIFSGEMEPEEIFIQSVEGTDAETAKNEKQQAKDEKAFNQIRRNLVLQAFGMTEEQYQKFMAEYEKVKSGEYDFKMSEADQVARGLDVAETQLISNKRGKRGRNLFYGLLKIGISASVGLLTSMVVARIVPDPDKAIRAGLTAGSIATASIESIINFGKSVIDKIKGERITSGNVGDYEEKQLAAIEKLIPLMEKIKKLEDALEADKTMIMDKKKTLKGSEFNNFMVSYLKEKMDELGLENDLQAQANEVAQKRVDANNDLSMDEEQEEFDQEQEELNQEQKELKEEQIELNKEQEELDPELDEEMKRKMIENGIQME